MGSEFINLDANASFGLLPEVQDFLRELPEGMLNASSIHRGGQKSRALIEEARDEIGRALGGVKNGRIVFTSGATEANNMAIGLPFASCGSQAGELVISAYEHPSVREAAFRLQTSGVKVKEVGAQSPTELIPSILANVTANTKLLSLMLANNETGDVFEVNKLKAACSFAPYIHTDCVQAFGKLPLFWNSLGVDMLSLSAHKIGGLPGVGALVLREGLPNEPFIVGGPQETRWRAGTENIVGIVSFGIAAKCVRDNRESLAREMEKQKSFIERYLSQELSDVTFHRFAPTQLPNTLNVHTPGVNADDLVVALDLKNILISSGAACASGKPEPSHVLLALGKSEKVARESIRISVTGLETMDQIRRAAEDIVSTVREMRGGVTA